MKRWLVATIALGAIVSGCPGSRAPKTSAPSDADSGFVRIREDAPAPPSADDLVREALDGASLDKETSLHARMQLRTLPMPHPARGANARFNFGDGRRGWITAMPAEQLLNT